MSSTFQFASGRDRWERQTGEPADEFDWFTHWRNDGHRRSYPRTAERFDIKVARVQRAAGQNRWAERLEAYKQANSRAIQERFEDLVETGLVPFAQAFAKLSAWAVQAPTEKVSADRALAAATGALRVIKEPGVADLIRISAAAGTANRELDLADLILDALAERFPEAHDAVLDAIQAATEADG